MPFELKLLIAACVAVIVIGAAWPTLRFHWRNRGLSPTQRQWARRFEAHHKANMEEIKRHGRGRTDRRGDR